MSDHVTVGVCPKCGKVHAVKKLVSLGIPVPKDELDSLRIIINRINCADQALNPRNIPLDATQDQVNRYVVAQNAAKADGQWLEQDWWQRMQKKFSLPDNATVDFMNEVFAVEEEVK
jgi:hypothetical protein